MSSTEKWPVKHRLWLPEDVSPHCPLRLPETGNPSDGKCCSHTLKPFSFVFFFKLPLIFKSFDIEILW